MPFKVLPSKVLRASFGRSEPLRAGVLLQVAFSIEDEASSSKVASISAPWQANTSIKVMLVEVSLCSNVKTRSPTNPCVAFNETFRSVRVPEFVTFNSLVVSLPVPIAVLDVLQRPVEPLGVAVGIFVGPG